MFDNTSTEKKINEWVKSSYDECRASYFLPYGKLSGGVAIDVGANVGGFCIHAHKNFDKIFAFEPVLENYNILCQVLEQMNIKNVEAYNTAIFSESGLQLPMKVYGGNEKNSKLISGDVTCISTPGDNFKNIDQVCETISLKDALISLGLENISYLKLDCEGSEYDILENFHDYDKINYICMEIHNYPDAHGIERKMNLIKNLEEYYFLWDAVKHNGVFKFDEIVNKWRDKKENYLNFEKSSNISFFNRNLV